MNRLKIKNDISLKSSFIYIRMGWADRLIEKSDTLNWIDRSYNTPPSSPIQPKTNDEIIKELEHKNKILEQKNSEYYWNEKKLKEQLIEEQEKQLHYKLNKINKHIEVQQQKFDELLDKYKQLHNDKNEILKDLIKIIIKNKFSQRKVIKIQEIEELFKNDTVFNAQQWSI